MFKNILSFTLTLLCVSVTVLAASSEKETLLKMKTKKARLLLQSALFEFHTDYLEKRIMELAKKNDYKKVLWDLSYTNEEDMKRVEILTGQELVDSLIKIARDLNSYHYILDNLQIRGDPKFRIKHRRLETGFKLGMIYLNKALGIMINVCLSFKTDSIRW